MSINPIAWRPLMMLAGLLVCFSGTPALSAEEDGAPEQSGTAEPKVFIQKQDRQPSHRLKKAHRRSSKVVLKSTSEKQANAVDAWQPSPTISAAVANASAELRWGETWPGNAAMAMSARANNILGAGADRLGAAQLAQAPLVSADQLNDVDRALHESPSAGVTVARATIDVAAAPPASVTWFSSDGSSVWQKSSLIGKIFIGLGALLTMASAARMFMT